MGNSELNTVGQSVRRKEDYRFLTGCGQYTDDVNPPHHTHAYFLRSPHAHANIRRIDTAKAKAAPGVVAVYTGADLTGVNGLPCGWLITGTDGQPMKEPPHPVLAQGKVRYVGDGLAMVIAETPAQAKDAAELIDVDYDAVPAVVNPVEALKAGAPQIHDGAPGNKCYTWALGDRAAVDAAFAKAAHVTQLDIVNNRLIPNAIEPRAAVASYSRADDGYTLYVTSQNPHVERLLMTAFVLGLPETKVRVIAPDVGGGFGSKIYLYPEETAMVWASKRVNRPIKWTAERSESFLSDAHGRDHVTHAELALDNDGKFLAMRVHTTAAMGAYLSTFASCIPTILYATLLAGQYTTPAIYCEVTAVFTNTAPVDAYRGAGRPEATYVVERLVYAAAAEMGSSQDVASRLGIPIENVEIVHGDTGRIPFGMGTYGSRSLAVGGTAIIKALDKVVAKGKKIAAHLLEAAEADIEFKDGKFNVAGTDRSKAFGEVALAAYVPHNYPLDKLEPGLDETAFYDPTNFTFPAGTHICEVEIDPETGTVEIVNFSDCGDFGNIINPMIVEGQVHGGVVQGIGQALLEQCVYDQESGQLLTGSYMDYALPRADDVPSFKVTTKVTPCTHNPLGAKGCGEAGAIGAPAALMNAVHDALSDAGVNYLDMPATPHRVWAAIQTARHY